ncbi:MAG: hypothetical protein L0I76_24975 [Pseudonocardia sp.]|nr:hypothetical protein [Pseudonocardia sp.]
MDMMTYPRPEFPAEPADVPGPTSFPELATALGEHRGRLVGSRYGLGETLPAERVAAHAVAALATAHALAERVLWSRWTDAVDALTHGATLGQVAQAMDLTPAEVRTGLRSWADGQQRANAHYGSGGLTPAEADEVRALVAEVDW